METIRYSRKTAVENGHRSSTEINKGFIKRPAIRMLKKNVCTFKHPKYSTYEHESVLKNLLEIPSNLAYGSIGIKAYIEGDKEKLKKYIGWCEKKQFISTKDLVDQPSFKNKVINVYVEKQHKNIYTLRNCSGVLVNVVDVDLGEFHDIAGKLVLINLSKKNGIYKINHILKVMED